MGKTEFTHSGPVPAGVSKERTISLLHDHAAFFKASDSYREHKEVLDKAEIDKLTSSMKQCVMSGASGTTVKVYTIRNEVPNPVFDSNVNSTYVMVDVTDGMWYFATSPLGVTNEALWTVKEGENGLELCYTIKVECNLMLKSIVNGQVKSSSQQIHQALIELLKSYI